MSEDKQSYGIVTVGTAEQVQHDIKITSFLKGTFLDNRVASICQLEDDTLTLSIESPPSTGRSNQNMRLSKESLLGVLSVTMLYFKLQGLNFETELEKALGGNKTMDFQCSDNINPDKDATVRE